MKKSKNPQKNPHIHFLATPSAEWGYALLSVAEWPGSALQLQTVMDQDTKKGYSTEFLFDSSEMSLQNFMCVLY